MRNKILPGHLRYQPKELEDFFGYDNLFHTVAEVELATLEVLGDIGVIPKEEIQKLTPNLIEEIKQIPTSEVDEIERNITKHDVRAWVKRAQEIIGHPLSRWVHVPLTSYDPLDTGRTLQFSRAYNEALKPSVRELIELLSNKVEEYADTVQIGRTHGQHALPITVGFWLATILNRVVYNAQKMEAAADQLVGKVSGAVGAHNAIVGLSFEEKSGDKSFEERVLEKLGVKKSNVSTQILPPEPVAYFLFSCAMLSSTLAQFGRDSRHLMRSEIGELSESFEKGQVGSSTMAHKRNPISFENLEGMWLKTKNEFGKVLDTLISEHQRDLVGSSVARDFPTILVNLQYQLNTLLKKNEEGISFIERVKIDEEACERNFDKSAHLILAEPLYIALQMAGLEGDAHHFVNHELVPKAIKERRQLVDVLKEHTESKEVVERIPEEIISLLQNPEKYTGDAREKALEVVKISRKYIKS